MNVISSHKDFVVVLHAVEIEVKLAILATAAFACEEETFKSASNAIHAALVKDMVPSAV